MQVLQEMPKKPATIMETICEYCNEWRMSVTTCGPYASIARVARLVGYEQWPNMEAQVNSANFM
jgi:hypothetical protein